MANSKPAALCTQLMPSGKLCRGVALRNQHYCRAHIRKYRLLERERQHEEAMHQLGAELDRMDIPELLQTLQTKLNRITSIVRAYPEARLTLVVAINRLMAANAQFEQPSPSESIASPQGYPNQSLTDLFNEMSRVAARSSGSNR